MATDVELVVKSKLPIKLILRQATGKVLLIFDSLQVGCYHLLLVNPRSEQGVVVNDSVGNQPGTHVPDLLLRLGFHPEIAGGDVGDGLRHAVVGLAAIEHFL